MKEKTTFKAGVIAGIPVFIGYIPIAIAFGILAKATGVSLPDTGMFSILVFAGASQFMALNLIQSGAAATETILATLLLNFRHFLMSASLAVKLDEDNRNRRKGLLALASFGITDETFTVAATREGKITVPFLIGLGLVSYLAWVGGSIAGFLLGAALPSALQKSMGIALYAMFVAILVPGIRKSLIYAVLALGAGTVHTLIINLKILPEGWSLVGAIIVTALAGAIFVRDGVEQRG